MPQTMIWNADNHHNRPTTVNLSPSKTSATVSSSNALMEHLNDADFLKMAEILIDKWTKSPGKSIEGFLFTALSAEERSNFSQAYTIRYQRMPMFPAADETLLQRWMRRIEEIFGDIFLRKVSSSNEMTIQVNQDSQNLKQNTSSKCQVLQHDVTSQHRELRIDNNKLHIRENRKEKESDVRYGYPRLSNFDLQTRLIKHPAPGSTSRPLCGKADDGVDLARIHPIHAQQKDSKSPHSRLYENSLTTKTSSRALIPTHRHYVSGIQNLESTPYEVTPTSILKKSRNNWDPVAQIIEILPPIENYLPADNVSSVETRGDFANSTKIYHAKNNESAMTNRVDYGYEEHIEALKTQLQYLQPNHIRKAQIVVHEAEQDIDVNLKLKNQKHLRGKNEQNLGPTAEMESILKRESKEIMASRVIDTEPPDLEQQKVSQDQVVLVSPVTPNGDLNRYPPIQLEVCNRTQSISANSRHDDPNCKSSRFESLDTTQLRDAAKNRAMSPNLELRYEPPILQNIVNGSIPIDDTIPNKDADQRYRKTCHIVKKFWKAGLCSCFSYGLFHPVCIYSFFCPQSKLVIG
jgi:hypothetical protein